MPSIINDNEIIYIEDEENLRTLLRQYLEIPSADGRMDRHKLRLKLSQMLNETESAISLSSFNPRVSSKEETEEIVAKPKLVTAADIRAKLREAREIRENLIIGGAIFLIVLAFVSGITLGMSIGSAKATESILSMQTNDIQKQISDWNKTDKAWHDSQQKQR